MREVPDAEYNGIFVDRSTMASNVIKAKRYKGFLSIPEQVIEEPSPISKT
jgi:hypothetical protein